MDALILPLLFHLAQRCPSRVEPVGFVSDHAESLYDIDIMAQRVAAGLGIRLERPPALNDDHFYIHILADTIQSHSPSL